jgi:hypothetical protein
MRTRLLTKALATVQAQATAKHVTVEYLLHQLLDLIPCECGRCTPQEEEEKDKKEQEGDGEEEEKEEAKAEEQEEEEPKGEAEEGEPEPRQRDELLLYRESASGEHKVTHTNARSNAHPETENQHSVDHFSDVEVEAWFAKFCGREEHNESKHNRTSDSDDESSTN